ncbi:MAG: outermembrane protein, partial [uncultured Solirubrobacteraceae bacterium]
AGADEAEAGLHPRGAAGARRRAGRAGRRREPSGRRRLPGLPELERLEPRRLARAGRPPLRGLRPLDRARLPAPRLRRRRRVRHPVPRRPARPAARPDPLHGLRGRVRSRPVPRPARRARRGRLGPSRDRPAPGHLRPLRALRRRAHERRVERGVGRPVGPALQPAPPRGLDLRGRRRPPDPPGPRPLRRGGARRDRARAAIHRPPLAGRLRLPGDPLRVLGHEPLAPADGAAAAAQALVPDRRLPRPRAGDPQGAAPLRDDRRRQRVELVRHGRRRSTLGRRGPRPAQAGPGPRVRGRPHGSRAARPL